MSASWAVDERALLEAARGGDEQAYRRLVEPFEGQLHAHCYRMLGSLHDAEDALQEALLRAWRALPRFEGRSSLRSWLYTIATNTCLNAAERRSRQRVLPIDYGPAADPHDGPGQPLVESVWIEPYPDDPEASFEQRESVELAFVAALQHLPPRQRAVLILRDVLGFSAAEVADALETSVASVNSAMQRARAAVDERVPEASQQETLRALGDDEVRELVERYADAWERGDVDGLVSMLAEDALVAMPPMATWFAGRDGVEVFLRDFAFGQRWSGERFEPGDRRVRVVPVRASGQLAFATYRFQDGSFRAQAIQVVTLRGREITDITGFVDPGAFSSFRLPDELAA